LSENFLKKAAPAVGMTKESLEHLVDELRELRAKQESNIQQLSQRLQSVYFRCVVYERKLNLARPESNWYQRTKLRYDKARKRLESLRKRMAEQKVVASNSQVARVLGLSKGTVDASLYRLKDRIGSLYGPEFPTDPPASLGR
jgi:hypothetical protein